MALSKPVIKGLMFILKAIKNFIYDTYRLVRYPLDVVFCLISGPYSYCKDKARPVYYKVRRIGKLPFNIIKDTKKTVSTYFKKK